MPVSDAFANRNGGLRAGAQGPSSPAANRTRCLTATAPAWHH